jgi:hypothetical protein
MALLLPIVGRFTLFAGCLLAALFRSGVPSPPPRDRAAAAVLLADPEYNPADPRTAGSTFEPPLRGSPRRPAFPAPLNGRVRSYCRRHDIVCQRDDPATMLYAIVDPGLDQMQVCLAGHFPGDRAAGTASRLSA